MEVLAILFSPIIAVLISIWISHNLQKRNDKLEIFKVLMTTRESKLTMEFVKAVNSIDVIFCDKQKVRKAWQNLYKSYASKDLDNIDKNHTKLLEVMANELGYKDKITWEHITSSYTPNWLMVDRENESKYKELQMQLMENAVENAKEKETKESTESSTSEE